MSIITENFIQHEITNDEKLDIIKFLSYHFKLPVDPHTMPDVVYAYTAEEFAQMYQNYKYMTDDNVHRINTTTSYFFDQSTTPSRIVFPGFSYVDRGVTIDQFYVPVSGVIHEFIHFFQYCTGGWGTYYVLYEGIPELLSSFFTNDYRNVDYDVEMSVAFSIVMEMHDHNVEKALAWMLRYCVVSGKGQWARSWVKSCKTFRRWNPHNLLRTIDHIIKSGKSLNKGLGRSPAVYKALTRYNVKKIEQLLGPYHRLVFLK